MILTMNDINKSYGARQILKDIQLKIEDQDRIGLIGVNGSGKSTLLQIITGRLEFESGSLSVSQDKTIGFLQQNSGLESSNTIQQEMLSVFQSTLALEREMRRLEQQIASISSADTAQLELLTAEYSQKQQLFESRDGYMIPTKIKTVLNGMGFADRSSDTPVGTLSGGEKTRLALAKLLLEEPDLLILDEPTNHLDFKTLNWLEEYLLAYKGAILVVSHDRYFLDKIVTSVCEIENLKLIRYPGNYSKYLLLKEERITRMQKEYDAQVQEIADMKDFIARNIVRASTSKSAKSRIAALDRMELVEKPVPPPKPPHFSFTYEREPVKDVLAVYDLELAVGQGIKRRVLSHAVNFNVRRGEKIAIVGTNGVGKSSLLKAVQGLLPYEKGRVEWGKNVQYSYYDQHNASLHPDSTVIDELWNRFPRSYEHTIRSVLGQVTLTGENVFKKVEVISGGEKAKLSFAILMMEHANVLILDEPTNHLDIATKEALDDALREYTGTILMVSHDRYLLNKIPTKMIEMTPCVDAEGRPDVRVDVYNGNYDYYLEKHLHTADAVEEPERAPTPVQKSSAASNGYRSRQQKNEEIQRKLALKTMEERIIQTEEAIAALEEEIQQPEIAADYAVMTQKCATLEETRTLLNELYQEWEKLCEPA